MKKSDAQPIMTKADAHKIAISLGVVMIILTMILTLCLIFFPESTTLVLWVGFPIWGIAIIVSGILLKNYFMKGSIRQ